MNIAKEQIIAWLEKEKTQPCAPDEAKIYPPLEEAAMTPIFKEFIDTYVDATQLSMTLFGVKTAIRSVASSSFEMGMRMVMEIHEQLELEKMLETAQ